MPEITLQEFLDKTLPLLMSKTVVRVDTDIEDFGRVTAYWVVDVLRIDIKPLTGVDKID